MVESKTKRNARLKALRRKHGLGEFSKRKRNTSKKRVSKTRRRPIKLKRRNISKMARKKRVSRRRRTGMFGALQKPLVAGITFAFVQPIMSQFLSRFNIGIQDELVTILAAVVLRNVVRNRIVTAWSDAAIIISTASLVSGFSGNIFGTGITATPTSGRVLIG